MDLRHESQKKRENSHEMRISKRLKLTCRDLNIIWRELYDMFSRTWKGGRYIEGKSHRIVSRAEPSKIYHESHTFRVLNAWIVDQPQCLLMEPKF